VNRFAAFPLLAYLSFKVSFAKGLVATL
jgi:hypothetical protein